MTENFTEKNKLDIHNIIMKTLKVVPKAWDMHHQNFNCDCHLKLTDETNQLIGEKFNLDNNDSQKLLEEYLILTNGYI